MSRLKLLPFRDLARLADAAGFHWAITLFAPLMAASLSFQIMAALLSCVHSCEKSSAILGLRWMNTTKWLTRCSRATWLLPDSSCH